MEQSLQVSPDRLKHNTHYTHITNASSSTDLLKLQNFTSPPPGAVLWYKVILHKSAAQPYFN